MTDVDELGRAAATALRASVRVDADAGLRRLHESVRSGGPGRRRWWAVAGAAAVVALGVAGFVVLDHSPSKQSPAPATIPVTVTTMTPTTGIPATSAAVAPTTIATTTSAAPVTSTTTTTADAAASDLTLFAAPPVIDLPPRLVDLPLPGCDPACPSLATAADGTLVAWDHETQTFSLLAPDAAAAEQVALQAPEITGDTLVAVGPDDVAYLLAFRTRTPAEDVLDFVAVPLRGPNAGTVVATVERAGDISGDTDYAPTPQGLVAVGCCDDSTIRPDLRATPVMSWVDSSGRPTVAWNRLFAFDATPGSMAVLPIGTDVPIPVDDALDVAGVRGMPLLAGAVDGGVFVATWSVADSEWRLVRAGASDHSERIVVPPDGTLLVHLDPYGAIVVVDGTKLARWTLPGYGAPRSFDPGRELTPEVFGTADEAVQGMLDALRADTSCENPTTAALTGTEQVGISVVARYDVRSGCDDSIAGAAVAIQFVRGDGDWFGQTGVEAPLCSRGVSDGRCV